MKEVSMFFDWKNSVMYKIIMGKSPIEPDLTPQQLNGLKNWYEANTGIDYNAPKSIETVPDGVDPEMTSGYNNIFIGRTALTSIPTAVGDSKCLSAPTRCGYCGVKALPKDRWCIACGAVI